MLLMPVSLFSRGDHHTRPLEEQCGGQNNGGLTFVKSAGESRPRMTCRWRQPGKEPKHESLLVKEDWKGT